MSWKHFEIPNGEGLLFCNTYITDKTAMNVIVTHTPIITTLEMQQSYEPLAKYGVNIFAFDFSGTGKSSGNPKEISRQSVVKDLDTIVDYIENNYSSDIHLYGNTGIGGMLAQYYATTSTKIKSFAQFAPVNYKDTSGGLSGFPYPIAKMLSSVIDVLPNMRISLVPPKYQGFRCDEMGKSLT